VRNSGKRKNKLHKANLKKPQKKKKRKKAKKKKSKPRPKLPHPNQKKLKYQNMTNIPMKYLLYFIIILYPWRNMTL
jgi:hypothetical protein